MKYSILFFILIAACSADDATPIDAGNAADLGSDSAPPLDAMSDMAADVGADANEAPVDLGADMTTLAVTAENYCELTVDFFCAYYMRCGRMAAADFDECKSTFLETCNDVYEPVYRAYSDAAVLRLDAAGMAQCEAHLDQVVCAEQLFDLDGGCSDMWKGLSPVNDACAPGIGSFICGEESTCVIGLDLCGTCEPAAALGESCETGVIRCDTGAQCVDGTCVARGLPGDACNDELRCVVGASCQNDICVGFDVVAVGEACGQAERCPYKSTCQQGFCVESGLIGESCVDRACASGFCDGQVCQPLRDALEGCSENVQCLSGNCNGQFCGPLVSQCLTQ